MRAQRGMKKGKIHIVSTHVHIELLGHAHTHTDRQTYTIAGRERKLEYTCTSENKFETDTNKKQRSGEQKIKKVEK